MGILIVANPVKQTFAQAQHTCEIHGGKLVEICNAELNRKLKTIAERKIKLFIFSLVKYIFFIQIYVLMAQNVYIALKYGLDTDLSNDIRYDFRL